MSHIRVGDSGSESNLDMQLESGFKNYPIMIIVNTILLIHILGEYNLNHEKDFRNDFLSQIGILINF